MWSLQMRNFYKHRMLSMRNLRITQSSYNHIHNDNFTGKLSNGVCSLNLWKLSPQKEPVYWVKSSLISCNYGNTVTVVYTVNRQKLHFLKVLQPLLNPKQSCAKKLSRSNSITDSSMQDYCNIQDYFVDSLSFSLGIAKFDTHANSY